MSYADARGHQLSNRQASNYFLLASSNSRRTQSNASGHFGYAQAGLCGQEKKRVIAPAEPGALVRSGEQGVDFRTREKLHQGPRETRVSACYTQLSFSGARDS